MTFIPNYNPMIVAAAIKKSSVNKRAVSDTIEAAIIAWEALDNEGNIKLKPVCYDEEIYRIAEASFIRNGIGILIIDKQTSTVTSCNKGHWRNREECLAFAAKVERDSLDAKINPG